MENRIKGVIKLDLERPVVYRARSFENEIRFYINFTQYFSAVEIKHGALISLGEDKDNEHNEKSKFDIFHIINMISSLLIACGTLYLINNFWVNMIVINIAFFINNIVLHLIRQLIASPEIKRKHSAEHMMINFIENNKRLPRNINEVKKSSRFSKKCSSTELVEINAKILIPLTVSAIILYFFSDSIIGIIIYMLIYLLLMLATKKIIIIDKLVSYIIYPIVNILTIIIQCANTTKRVKDEDIILAYSVAEAWLKVVYPQFYDENDKSFWEKYECRVNDRLI